MPLYRVTHDDSLIMIAPLAIIAQCFSLHRDGTARIQRECMDGGECSMHISLSGRYDRTTHLIHAVAVHSQIERP